MSITQIDQTYVAHTYGRFPVEIVSGKGSLLYGADGKEYIDMGSGIGVTAFGNGDETWKEAVIAQLGLVQHTSNLYYTEPCAKLAQLLCEKTGMKKVFFSNSGAEANECAIKVARKYAQDKKGPDYGVIVTMKNSFHGRTLTTLAATGQDHYHELFNPLTPGFISVDAGDVEQLKKVCTENKVAGILLECIQGEGGVIVQDPAYVKAVRSLTEELDIIMMVDEVQTGNGRTGAFYAYMNYGITPDVVSTAKGLMIGIKTKKPAGEVVKACIEQGVLCLTAKDKVRLLPALNIPMELLDKAISVLKQACK